jgi:hypothetical protein
MGGVGDDTVYAFSKGPVEVDCGPGNDAVFIGFNRHVRTQNCEQVDRQYRKR